MAILFELIVLTAKVHSFSETTKKNWDFLIRARKKSTQRALRTFVFASDAPLNDLVLQQTALGKLLIFGAGATVVGIGIDTDAATGGEDADNLDIFGIH